MMNKHLRLFAIVIAAMMLCSVIPVSAAENQEQINWESKISNELLEVMASKTDTDLIPVYIWLNDIDHNVITEAMIKEKEMDPAIYENEERFQKEIVSEIEAQLVSRVGYEATHYSVDATTNGYILNENGAYHDDSMSLLDRAVQAKTNEYIPDKKHSLNIRYSNSSFFFHDFQNLFSSFNREQHCLLLHSKPRPFNFKNQRYRRFRIPLYTVSYRLSRERKEIFGYYCDATLLPCIFEANLLTKSTSRGIILAVWISFWIPDICR